MSLWEDPEKRKACIFDAIVIAILSAGIAGFFGLLIGLYLGGL